MRPSLAAQGAANGICGSSPSVGSSHKRRGEAHQIAVAGFALRQEHDRSSRVVPFDGAQQARAAASAKSIVVLARPMIGWTPALASFSENSRAPNRLLVSAIASAGMASAGGELGERLDCQRSLAERISAVHMQMHEADGLENSRGPWIIVASAREGVESLA